MTVMRMCGTCDDVPRMIVCCFFWQAKVIAVTTVSQLLDAGEAVFQKAAAAATDNDDTFAT